jgi:hypothetical protein
MNGQSLEQTAVLQPRLIQKTFGGLHSAGHKFPWFASLRASLGVLSQPIGIKIEPRDHSGLNFFRP